MRLGLTLPLPNSFALGLAKHLGICSNPSEVERFHVAAELGPW